MHVLNGHRLLIWKGIALKKSQFLVYFSQIALGREKVNKPSETKWPTESGVGLFTSQHLPAWRDVSRHPVGSAVVRRALFMGARVLPDAAL